MSIIDRALASAARGWHVFPCGGKGNPKTPRDGWRWAAWNTTDPAKIRQWLAGVQAYGIACGPSGLVVADLDMPKQGYKLPGGWADEPGIHDGRDVFAALCELMGSPWPSTYAVVTPSGGWHLYFTADPGRRITVTVGDVAPMVDIRGIGGYVVGPGSIVGGRVYETFHDTAPEPMPGWLAEACERSARQTSGSPAKARYGNGQPAIHRPGYFRAALAAEAGIVASTPEPGRNVQLNKSAYTLARFVASGQLSEHELTAVLIDAAARAGLPDAEAQRTIRSALKARRCP